MWATDQRAGSSAQLVELTRRTMRRAGRALAVRVRRSGAGATPRDIADLGSRVGHPLAALYVAGGRPVAIDVALAHLRTSLGTRGDAPESSPFALTILECRSGVAVSYERSALRRHFDTWQPATFAEAIGLGVPPAGSPLAASPRSLTTPWSPHADRIAPSGRVTMRDAYMRAEGRQYGRVVDPLDGHPQFGPATPAYGALEFDRYCATAHSIAEQGFIAHLGGYIVVELLVRGDEWVVRVKSGHHRIAAVAALNVDPVKVLIDTSRAVARRDDVRLWPGVRSGLFTVDQATDVFDRIFDGRAPSPAPQPSVPDGSA